MIDSDPKAEKKFYIGPIQKFLMLLVRLFAIPLVGVFFQIINNTRRIGAENIPKGGGVIFAVNHISGIDTIMVPYFSVFTFGLDPYCSPAKEDLFKIPVIGWLLPLFGGFPVKRKQRDFTAMRRMAYVAKHYRMMVFPEGTRSKTGELGKGRAGLGWVIYQARPKVIPTLVINTENYFWPGNKRQWFRNPYVVVYGKELDLSRFYDMPDEKETSQKIVNEIMDAIAKMKEEHKGLRIG